MTAVEAAAAAAVILPGRIERKPSTPLLASLIGALMGPAAPTEDRCAAAEGVLSCTMNALALGVWAVGEEGLRGAVPGAGVCLLGGVSSSRDSLLLDFADQGGLVSSALGSGSEGRLKKLLLLFLPAVCAAACSTAPAATSSSDKKSTCSAILVLLCRSATLRQSKGAVFVVLGEPRDCGALCTRAGTEIVNYDTTDMCNNNTHRRPDCPLRFL